MGDSTPLLEDPPPVQPYPPGSWGPNEIHQLIAPHAWRLPFERKWRGKPDGTLGPGPAVGRLEPRGTVVSNRAGGQGA